MNAPLGHSNATQQTLHSLLSGEPIDSVNAPEPTDTTVPSGGREENEEPETQYIIHYAHYDCPVDPDIKWTDVWSCACNGECPACGTKDIEPVDWEHSLDVGDDAEECEECGHPVRLHDAVEGCTYERGDRYTPGYAPMAMGPCGCSHEQRAE